MATISFDVKELPPNVVAAISSANAGSEFVILDNQIEVARIVTSPRPVGPRIPGLHPGSMQMSDDFDAPLSDEFWSGAP